MLVADTLTRGRVLGAQTLALRAKPRVTRVWQRHWTRVATDFVDDRLLNSVDVNGYFFRGVELALSRVANTVSVAYVVHLRRTADLAMLCRVYKIRGD